MPRQMMNNAASKALDKQVAKKSPAVKKLSTKVTAKKASKASLGRKAATAQEKLLVTVVDQHHHVMKPIWDAVRSSAIPGEKVKLLHFDSHPDMGCIGADDTDPNSDEYQRCKDIIPKIFKNKFNEQECLELSDIATWIPTFVAQGLVDEVIWVCGAWCNQFGEKTIDLVVGRSTIDGQMKIGAPGDKLGNAVSYWSYDGSLEKLENLVDVRPWKLHVVKFQKNSKLSKTGIQRIVDVCKGKPWILDIDEDYLSTQNPFTTEFHYMFGKEAHDDLMKTWDANCYDTDVYQENLEKIVKEDIFLQSKAKFRSHEAVHEAIRQLTHDKDFSKAAAEKMLDEFREMCKTFLPARDDEEEYIHERKRQNHDVIVQTAYLESVPHHISTLPQMVEMTRSTRTLFEEIKTEPGVVTVATSRADMYTPEPQADVIHNLIIGLLKRCWSKTRKTKVVRRDFRSPLSICDNRPNLLALFMSRGKKMDLE